MLVSNYKISEVRDLNALEEIRPEWENLLSRIDSPTVFDCWGWHYCCAKWFAKYEELFVLVVRQEERMVAIFPLKIAMTQLNQMVSAKTVTCLGGEITDYNSLLLDRQSNANVNQALQEYFIANELVLVLDNVIEGSALRNLIDGLVNRKFRSIETGSSQSRICPLDHGYEVMIRELRKKFRNNLRSNQNYMDRKQGYSYHCEPSDQKTLELFFKMHTERWEDRGESGAMAADQIRQFHADLLCLPQRDFDIRYYSIRHNDEVVSILYGFLIHDKFYFYLSGFNPNHGRISPGNMVINFSMKCLCDENILSYDMLRGEMKYKREWARKVLTLKNLIMFPPTSKGRVTYIKYKTIQSIKNLFPKGIKRKLKSVIDR